MSDGNLLQGREDYWPSKIAAIPNYRLYNPHEKFTQRESKTTYLPVIHGENAHPRLLVPCVITQHFRVEQDQIVTERFLEQLDS